MNGIDIPYFNEATHDVENTLPPTIQVHMAPLGRYGAWSPGRQKRSYQTYCQRSRRESEQAFRRAQSTQSETNKDGNEHQTIDLRQGLTRQEEPRPRRSS